MWIKLFIVLNIIFILIMQLLADCVTPNGELGSCVALTSCPGILRAFANPVVEMQEYLKKYFCVNGGVCCTSLNRAFHNRELSDKRYCGYQHFDDYTSSTPDDISIDEFPWLAGIKMVNLNTTQERIMCGGALINSRYVLTTAHCVKDVEKFGWSITTIRLGEFHIENKTDCINIEAINVKECNEFQDFGIEELKIHPFYMRRDITNDIALIRLDKKVTYSDYIRPICLPSFGIPLLKPGDLLYTTGWGKNRTEDQSKIKKKIILKLITNSQCELHVQWRQNITQYEMCTLDTIYSKDHSCKGDSGAPIMVSLNHQWYLVGIMSFGDGVLCHEGSISILTKVFEYIPWITENMYDIN